MRFCGVLKALLASASLAVDQPAAPPAAALGKKEPPGFVDANRDGVNDITGLRHTRTSRRGHRYGRIAEKLRQSLDLGLDQKRRDRWRLLELALVR
ncbi:MAG: hypothetical protein FJY95_14365 [Candidatus Handelsmanbacteria bacterium]|nr:hypothetical protein [Candidatus Handelsmanbacteria bacterium]